MLLYNSSGRDQFFDGEQRERRSFRADQDIGLGYDSGSSSDDRTKNGSLWNNTQLALNALFVASNVQVGSEPILPAVASFASFGLQHWLVCFWMGFLFNQLCDVAQAGSALYYNNLRVNTHHFYLSYRGRSNDHDCFGYEHMR